ncbi:hypothetical protein M378DRAFT_163034 [Amanita muscaria Koide BX008]|uniref:Uncharacterized protein n=1 Tax=Amanita muscaria (strain Koide BX008) TaxID=946122 RepID=A0A0C2TCQ8_AMAMK|nr:hypothetical protein M378DRAFT_163034 [Amanita muscaria Koide BX008]
MSLQLTRRSTSTFDKEISPGCFSVLESDNPISMSVVHSHESHSRSPSRPLTHIRWSSAVKISVLGIRGMLM